MQRIAPAATLMIHTSLTQTAQQDSGPAAAADMRTADGDADAVL